MPTDTPVNANRTERVLAYMMISTLGLSILCIVFVLVGSLVGFDLNSGLGATARLLPYIGIPLGLLLLIATVIVSGVRRARESRDAGR